MTGIVAVIVRIMPESTDSNLLKIKDESKKVLENQGAMNLSFEEKPMAFGLNSIKIKFAWPEEKDTSLIEDSLSDIDEVSSVEIEDYRRAFG
ncbi:MAG: elongation factor 1-beta [Nanoarchaeota archaeon]